MLRNVHDMHSLESNYRNKYEKKRKEKKKKKKKKNGVLFFWGLDEINSIHGWQGLPSPEEVFDHCSERIFLVKLQYQ